MQLSVNKDDPGYPAWRALGSRGRDVRVFVDGSEIKNAITADTEEGLVIINETGENGHILFNRESGEIYTKRIAGCVEIRMS